LAAKLQRNNVGTLSALRIVRHRIDAVLEALEPQRVGDTSIHDARKELKRARAALRLLRDALGKRTYKRENAAIRDAARPLGEIRDGRVLLDALSSLIKHYGASAAALPLTGFKRVLSRRRIQLREKILEQSGTLASTRRILRQVRSRSERWDVKRRGWSVLGAGLRRTYSSGRDALEQARAARTDEHLHEWRKQTKYFWHELQMLQPLRSLGALADRSHKLADLLGDDHDLAVLRERAVEARNAFPSQSSRDAFLDLIDRSRVGLQKKALALGQRLYEERPGAHAARLGKYRRDWRCS
jgi:CHAD domain-containing protein